MDGYSHVFNRASQQFEQSNDKNKVLESFRSEKMIFGFLENDDQPPHEESVYLAKKLNLSFYEKYVALLKDRPAVGYEGSSTNYADYNQLDSSHIMMSVFLFTKLPEPLKTVIEVGGGYGNWFYLNRTQPFKSWVTIDLPHVCELQKWYLSKMNIDLTKWTNVSAYDYSEYSNKPVDLVIGAHSLSQFSFSTFEEYFNNIVQHAKYFYYCYETDLPTPELIAKKLELIKTRFTVLDSLVSGHGKIINNLYKNEYYGKSIANIPVPKTVNKATGFKAGKKTICLNMIVKNESHIIEETLTHLLKYIQFDYWVISDTGSTDLTREIIKEFFKSRNIPGELVEHAWQDFGYNRTKAFEAAYNKSDYVFVWDADDEIYGNFKMPEILDADYYKFTFGGHDGMRYSRPQLFNNRKRWCFKGVLHEYANGLEPHGPVQDVRGDYFFISGRKGDRNKDPNKYLKDALILEKASEKALIENDPLYNRYIFYCAQSYNSCNRHEKAIEFYKKSLTLDLWIQEKYVSCIEIYDQYDQLKKPFEGLSYLVEAFKYDRTRIECAYRLIKYYCIQGMPDVAYMYYTMIKDFFENHYDPAKLGEKLFAKKAEYDFFLPYYMIILGERTKHYDTCIKMYEIIFKHAYVAPDWWTMNLFTNIQFVIPYLPKDPKFVQSLLDYVDRVNDRGIRLKSEHNNIIMKIIDVYRPQFETPSTRQITPRLSSPQIMLTMTTCKRYDLFERTVNSMLNNWKDLDRIDYFYCMDDNSSEEDRQKMRANYPFFDYYMKSPAERGHRESMNLIWNKLKELKPKYWIHLEDDWLYFRNQYYVSRALHYLEHYENKNIHQVVFNRNYGLMYNDMDRNGGIVLEPGFLLHEKRDDIVGKHCGYWPHYSLQPSMSRVSKILELGNYDSPNKFFERDYANKYFAHGNQTGFFNSIYSIHIGKQHWETEGKNAYALNEVPQFGAPPAPEPAPAPAPAPDSHPTLTILKNEPLPANGTMRMHLDILLQKITDGIPFGIIRPSDGERTVMLGETLTNCDNWTFKTGGILQKQLLEAVQTNDPNLYIGIPCNTCNKPWNCTPAIYNDFVEKFKINMVQRTYANIFGNSNWQPFIDYLKAYTKGFYVVTSGTSPSKLNILDRHIIDDKLVNVWDEKGEEETARLLKFIEPLQHQLICFSAGPLSKIWVPMCMKANPTNTYLDVGASIDVYTKGKTVRFYTEAAHPFAKEACRFAAAGAP